MNRNQAPKLSKDGFRPRHIAAIAGSALALMSTAVVGAEVKNNNQDRDAQTAAPVAAVNHEKSRKLSARDLQRIYRHNDTPEERKIAISVMKEKPQSHYDGNVVWGDKEADRKTLVSPILVQEKPLKTIGKSQNLTREELLSGSFAFGTLENKDGVPAVTITELETGMALEETSPHQPGQPIVISAVLGSGPGDYKFNQGRHEDGGSPVMSVNKSPANLALMLPR